jgi:N-acetylmuramoyl-L-alanine amidase
MAGTIRAVAMATAAIITCAFAAPSMALTIGSIPAASTSAQPVVSSVDGNDVAAPSPATLTPQILRLNPPTPFVAPPTTSPAPAITLSALVDARSKLETVDADRECIATAVYFEARGEPIEGQLAVAQVVLNRAASGRYPSSVCAVVKQRSQFSFIRRGKIPPIAKATEAWRKAVAIARIAWERLANQIGADVL